MNRAAKYFTEAAGLGLLALIAHLVPMVANVAGYNGYANGITTAHRFLERARVRFDSVTLVTTEPADRQGLNRRAELAFPPVGGVPAYIFPFLTALNGADFRVVSKAQFCSAPPAAGTLALLPEAVVGPGEPMELWGDRVLRRVKGYGFVFDRARYAQFAELGTLEIGPDDLMDAEFGEHRLDAVEPSVLTLHRLEQDGPAYRYVSTDATLDLRPPAHLVGQLTFHHDPGRDRPFESITVEYAALGGRSTRRITLDQGTEIAFSLTNATRIRVVMGPDAVVPEFKAHVFTVRQPALRVLRPLPAPASGAPFSPCR